MSTKNKRLLELIEKDLGPLSFAGYLRGARGAQELSQVAMAKMLGVTRSTLCDIEKGRHIVSPELAAKIAQKCGLSEIIAVTLALQDQLNRAKMKYRVKLVG